MLRWGWQGLRCEHEGECSEEFCGARVELLDDLWLLGEYRVGKDVTYCRHVPLEVAPDVLMGGGDKDRGK